MLYQLATKLKPQCHKFLPFVVKHIINGGVRNDAQFSAVLMYLLEHSTAEKLNEIEFESKCGINVIVTIEDIEDRVFMLL